jgi:hypothetical protein
MTKDSMTRAIYHKYAIAASVACALILSACGSAATETAKPTDVAKAPAAEAAKPVAAATKAASKDDGKAAKPTKATAPTRAAAESQKASPTQAAAAGAKPSGALRDRIAAANKAESYEATLKIIVKGDVIEMPLPTDGETPLVEMTQTKYKNDMESTISGVIAAFMGAEKGMRIRKVAGKSYVFGPVALMGAPTAEWYQITDEQAGTFNAPFEPNGMLQDLVKGEKSEELLKPSGSETIDGQTCEIFIADTEAVLKQDSIVGGDINKDFAKLEFAEIKLAICEDGFPHLANMQFKGTSKKSPDKPSEVQILMSFKNFNSVKPIEAPSDAKKSENPFGSQGETAPEATEEAGAGGDVSGDTGGTGAIYGAPENSEYPTIGKVADVMSLEAGMVNYTTDASLEEVYKFYVAEMSAKGYTERKITTIVSDSVVNLVMDGGDDGKAFVMQAVQLEPGKVNVNIRKEKV